MPLATAGAATSLPQALDRRAEPDSDAGTLLAVDRLSLTRGESLILDNVSFTLRRGATLGLVGESGAGKSTIALALIGLLRPPEVSLTGSIDLDQAGDVIGASENAWLKLRGRRVAMIFQDAAAALNPCFTIGQQITTPLRRVLGLGRSAARARAIELLESVGLNDAPSRIAAVLPENPHVKYFESRERGYVSVELSRDRMDTRFNVISDRRDPKATVSTLKRFVVEAGKPGEVPA
jgi:ABC-type uncharacterized transport system YnjBCD ATPase subunit